MGAEARDDGRLLFLYGGCTFQLDAGVQAPKAGSLLFCRHLGARAGERVLELGSGAGLAAVLAARAGASSQERNRASTGQAQSATRTAPRSFHFSHAFQNCRRTPEGDPQLVGIGGQFSATHALPSSSPKAAPGSQA